MPQLTLQAAPVLGPTSNPSSVARRFAQCIDSSEVACINLSDNKRPHHKRPADSPQTAMRKRDPAAQGIPPPKGSRRPRDPTSKGSPPSKGSHIQGIPHPKDPTSKGSHIRTAEPVDRPPRPVGEWHPRCQLFDKLELNPGTNPDDRVLVCRLAYRRGDNQWRSVVISGDQW